MTPLRIGISIGDVNGIGPEVVVTALGREGMLELFTPVIYATEEALSQGTTGELPYSLTTISAPAEARAGEVSLIVCWEEPIDYTPGQATASGGRAAAKSLHRAVTDLKNGELQALVTAPINKSVMPEKDFPYPGHTEMLTTTLGAAESLMFLVADELRVGVVTNHIPLGAVAGAVTTEKILEKLGIMHRCLTADFAIDGPLIAVLALNPHAGDEGRIGNEDAEIVRPAIEAAKKKGIKAMGPYPADGFFGSGGHRKFDAVLAMYHDQGLVPFKALSFGGGVNFTAGLPAIRTSPDHGTAYDIVGQNKANPDSFIAAMFLARETYANRNQHTEDSANPLESRMSEVYKRKGRKGRG